LPIKAPCVLRFDEGSRRLHARWARWRRSRREEPDKVPLSAAGPGDQQETTSASHSSPAAPAQRRQSPDRR